MATKDKTVFLGEGLHFRHDQSVGAGAAQPCQVGVVNNALPGGATPKRERLMQEALHFKASKAR